MEKNSWKRLQTWYECRVCFAFACQFYTYRIARNLVVHKNTLPEKRRALRPSSPLSRAILKHMCLLYGKTNRCRWNPKLVEVPHVHALAPWNMPWAVLFWLINLSNGLIFLIFVLDLGLDNMFLIFKVYLPYKLRNIRFMNM